MATKLQSPLLAPLGQRCSGEAFTLIALNTCPFLPARADGELTLAQRSEATQLDLGGNGEGRVKRGKKRMRISERSSPLPRAQEPCIQAASGKESQIWEETPRRLLGVREGVPRQGRSGEEDISMCMYILEKLRKQRGPSPADSPDLPSPQLTHTPFIRPRC